MIQIDHYRPDGVLYRCYRVEAPCPCADPRIAESILRKLAGGSPPKRTVATLGEVSVVRVDVGAAGFALLEHVA